MTVLRNYMWEVAQIAVMLGVITMLALVTHPGGTATFPVQPPNLSVPPPLRFPASESATRPISAARSRPPHLPPANPREVVVGPSGISNRYVLMSTERKPASSAVDELIIKLHVVSLAPEPLVSPFGSEMLEVRSPGIDPIKPKDSFHSPIPAGESQDKNVAFDIPAGLNLDKATLHIRYYNYQKQIPLNPAAHKGED